MSHNRHYSPSHVRRAETLDPQPWLSLAWLKQSEESGTLLVSGPNTEGTVVVLLVPADDLESARGCSKPIRITARACTELE